MKLPSSPIPKEELRQQAAILAMGEDTILERWAGLTHPERLQGRSAPVASFELYAHLPDVLKAVVDLLHVNDGDGDNLMDQARKHARSRAAMGYDQRSVIRECLFLRQCVLGYLEEQNDGEMPHFWNAVNYITSLLDQVAMEITDHFFLHFTEILQQRAESDPLTDLYNWQAFHDRVDNTMREVKIDKSSMILVILDLDAFKQVNDTRGHAVGDLILRHLAYLLRKHTRREDIVGRLGGDEFAICLRDADSSVVKDLITRLKIHLAPLKRDLSLPDSFGFSHGYAVYPDDATQVDELFLQADAKMYSKKRRITLNQDFTTFKIPDNIPKPVAVIIDPIYSVRFLCEKVLGQEGFTVYSYADCSEGLEAAKHCKPDVLVIDEDLAIDGADKIKKINDDRQHQMAIIQTYKGERESPEPTALRKPFDPESMLRLVHKQLLLKL